MSLIEILNIQAKGDERGQLIALENNKNIPFEIKRVYYLTQTREDVARGFHAHKELMQVAVCISGRCLMKLDDGINQEEVWLDSPVKAILIRKMIWREMHHFSPDCVLLVLASELYDEQDYIRSYSDFKLLAKSY
ncbi:WxcM-like domain-containing protein [Pseudomonas fluorescens]|jgi:dTDP-4-dehydrorhamnose 3,5-epimerase-like enzyme|uniref:sugar 3,4-ketoisomerase n=1 Tax=Pseudomonas TaxID=286 RepID=UPI000EA8C21B|nr:MULTISPECIES: FdtA/QdtA family cupin domain-containing protein [Pseudomonas]AYG07301.1 WxcM-like domain-containing protein [Pseudomonas fluorescens]MDZ4316960.1 FdtA/QdtA family cupin domain-containing protein [Azonexus sp.]MBJ2252857.1 WxcM-like domain-containing protein [Pseudomonas sp. MF6784]MBJ2263486.1 WxcM-like domain-containing protein [Pseudomonas sp. MF6787]MCM8561659.1 FdtA/QdtA family cupin domain-containing protein [Pseudomonas shahriarae]